MNNTDIILLHGALGSKKQFTELQEKLSVYFKVHSFDFTGHGDELIPLKPFSIELFTYDLVNYCIQHNIHVANIFGYSMGGYVALNYAAKFPEKINKIYTLATKFSWNENTAQKEVDMLNPDIIEQKFPSFAQNLIQQHGSNKWKILLNKTAEMMLKLGVNPVLKEEDFAKITAKCKLCVGDKDKTVSIEETEYVHNKINQSILYVFNNVGHPIEKIDVNILVNDIIYFFNKQ